MSGVSTGVFCLSFQFSYALIHAIRNSVTQVSQASNCQFSDFCFISSSTLFQGSVGIVGILGTNFIKNFVSGVSFLDLRISEKLTMSSFDFLMVGIKISVAGARDIRSFHILVASQEVSLRSDQIQRRFSGFLLASSRQKSGGVGLSGTLVKESIGGLE